MDRLKISLKSQLIENEEFVSESLITIPDNPKIATKDSIVISKPVIQCPPITPIKVNGIIDIIENGKK